MAPKTSPNPQLNKLTIMVEKATKKAALDVLVQKKLFD